MSIRLSLIAMIAIVAASNYLVQFPINDWLTIGAITYPVSFLVTELTNRFHGPAKARKIVYAGFAVAVLLSMLLATPRIALASGLAFLSSQLLDIWVFSKLRQQSWWFAPLASSIMASLLDTVLFWTLAFYGDDMPLLTLASGDFIAKVMIDFMMLSVYRWVIRNGTPQGAPCKIS